MKRLLCGALLIQLLGCWSASAVGLVIADRWLPPPGIPQPPPHWPPPWHHWRPRPEPYVFAPLEVSSIDVKTRISDQVATTTIEQEFYNPNSARIEGTFVCPLPKGAQIDKFTMEIDGKPCQAELLSADKARKIYEDIVRSMKDPALLEYSGRDMFKVRIFPFEPRSKRRISLKYTELLKSDSGMISYVLPLSVEKFSARPVSNVIVKVELESGTPLKSIYSPSHAIEVKRSGSRRATAVLESAEKALPTDFALYFAPEKDEIGMNLLTYRESGENGYFLFMASPGVDVKEREIVAKDIIFVLDTSGSMAGRKLEQAKKALEFCIENLNEKDRFELIRFATEVEPLFDKLQPADRDHREKALRFARELKPMGGTAINDALEKALSLGSKGDNADRPSIVIFLTDGRPTIGETSEDEIVRNVKKLNPRKDRVFCFGIGTDVNTHLLDKITEQTRAFSQYVLPEEDLELKVSSFYAKIKEPVLANPRLKVSGDPRLSKMYPSDLPDLFKGEQMIVAGRYSGSGDAAFTLIGKVNGVERKFTYEGRFPQSTSKHEFLPRLWATRRVGYLLDEIRLHGDNKELKDEITDLARQFGIVTPYTSYLIVEDEDRRRVPQETRLFRELQQDRAARRAGEELWGSFQADRGGVSGTAAARESYAYKSADAPAAAASGGSMESLRGLGLPAAAPGSDLSSMSAPELGKFRLAQYAQQAQFVSGKTFFQNKDQWVDSDVQERTNAAVVKVKFGSDDYFELARKHPSVLPWLALGRNVQFTLGNAIYQIAE